MTVLVINPGTLARRPYQEWLADYEGDIVMLGAAWSLRQAGESLPTPADGYRHAELLEDYTDDALFQERAEAIARAYGVTRVIAAYEPDLVRVGALRDTLGVPGQTEQSARAFVDKLLMRQTAKAGGLGVPDFAAVDVPADLTAFVAEHGYPAVLKPRADAAARGVHVLHTHDDLTRILADETIWHPTTRPRRIDEAHPGAFRIVETFVEGAMYHIDGIVIEGRIAAIWPASYHHRQLDFRTDSRPWFDIALDRDDPLNGRLTAFTERLLDVFPTPRTTTFHTEVFVTEEGSPVLCEVASRTPGLRIPHALRAMYGVDFRIAWPRAGAGLPVPELGHPGAVLGSCAAAPVSPIRLAGHVAFLSRPGIVVTAPPAPDFPWIEDFMTTLTPGTRMHAPTSAVAIHSAIAAHGHDRATVESRLRTATRWFEERLEVEPFED